MNKKLTADLSRAHEYYTIGKKVNSNSQILLTQQNGYLIPEEDEKTYKLSQKHLKKLLPKYNTRNIFDLSLKYGPYSLDYSENGSFLLLGGSKGHISLINWREAKLITEFNISEPIRDIKFLHNEQLFAVAQQKAVFIYDSQGIEIHYLKKHLDPQLLEFLPYHFLLVTLNHQGFLKYLDVSTGKPSAEHRFRFEHVSDMKVNPWNSVICIGDVRGRVTMWTPNINKPTVRLICHNGSCRSLAVDKRGLYLATAGNDNKLKIYDIRKFGESLSEYWTERPVVSLDISGTGLLSECCRNTVLVWKDWNIEKEKLPYMQHICSSGLFDSKFVVHEDFLGLGSLEGFSQICVPGSGVANFDSLEVNPFRTKRERQEHEVHSLLDKLSPESIMMNPHHINVVNPHLEEEREIKVVGKTYEERQISKMKEIAKRKKKEVLEENTQMASDMLFLEELELPVKKAKLSELNHFLKYILDLDLNTLLY